MIDAQRASHPGATVPPRGKMTKLLDRRQRLLCRRTHSLRWWRRLLEEILLDIDDATRSQVMTWPRMSFARPSASYELPHGCETAVVAAADETRKGDVCSRSGGHCGAGAGAIVRSYGTPPSWAWFIRHISRAWKQKISCTWRSRVDIRESMENLLECH